MGVILVVSVIAAARNGITKEAIRIGSLVVGLLIAMWGHGVLALELRPWIESDRIAATVAFALIFLGCLILGALLAYLLAGIWQLTGLGWLDRGLGACFGLIRGLVICAAALLGLVAFQPFAETASMVARSRVAPVVMNVARTAASMAPSGLKEAFGRGAAEIEENRANDRT